MKTFCWLLLLALTLADGRPASAQIPDFEAEAVFDEVWETVNSKFFDPELNGLDWDQMGAEFRKQAIAARSRIEFAGVMNEMLSQLGASHTAYFSTSDPKRYQLLGVFDFLAADDRLDLLEYEGIGIDTELVDGHVFVRSVFEGFPADEAGLKYGDEIVSVDNQPFRWVESFRGKTGQTVSLEIRRQEGGQVMTVVVPVATLNGRTMFEQAMEASVSITEQAGHKIGYVHVWSYAGRKYQDQLQSLLLFGQLSDCDGLVLDLRDGWGGASLEYLNLFREPIVEITTESRLGDTNNYSGVWGKPVTLLVNRRSTSGKELFSYGFRKLGLGAIVGETTAGAVLAGGPTMLSNGDVLYLAVTDIRVDGQRLEGVGVPPTVPVERPLPWALGDDPPRERAIADLVNQVSGQDQRPGQNR